MGMTTMQYLVKRIEDAGGFHNVTIKKSGVMYVVRLDGDTYDTYINVIGDKHFIISLPIGNKVDSKFFPSEERDLFLGFLKSYDGEHNAKTN